MIIISISIIIIIIIIIISILVTTPPLLLRCVCAVQCRDAFLYRLLTQTKQNKIQKVREVGRWGM